MNEYQLTTEDIAALRRLRNAGCAVCVFTPSEVGHVDVELIEDAMCEAGWRQIDWENELLEGESK